MQAAAEAGHKLVRKQLQKLKRLNPRDLDDLFHKMHVDEFKKIDCLECANCCKTTSPAIHESDLRRMANALKIKPADLVNSFLEIDEEGDYIFRKMPCPFLQHDYLCSIYNVRPKACREYPHTDRKRIYQILNVTSRNACVCPVVFNITEKLKK